MIKSEFAIIIVKFVKLKTTLELQLLFSFIIISMIGKIFCERVHVDPDRQILPIFIGFLIPIIFLKPNF